MSTAAIPVHVALVDESSLIGARKLGVVAGALNEQLLADFAPAWKVNASVGAYREAPPGTWAIHLQHGIDQPGAAGYHADEHRQPYAVVDLTQPDWTVTVSHELLEMLADPWGNRLHTAAAPERWVSGGPGRPARVRYLLEVCDPCEQVVYAAGGVKVSDFLLPHFYRSGRAGTRYSHTGAIDKPVEVLEGGYISWLDPTTGSWWQRFVENGLAQDHELGPADAAAGSLREWTDGKARERRAQ